MICTTLNCQTKTRQTYKSFKLVLSGSHLSVGRRYGLSRYPGTLTCAQFPDLCPESGNGAGLVYARGTYRGNSGRSDGNGMWWDAQQNINAMMRNVFFFFLSAAWISCTVGCGPGYDIVPASGTITLNGKPLSNAQILTQPISDSEDDVTPGPGSGAVTDDQGHFVLEFQHDDIVGAVPGKAYIKIVELGERKVSSDDAI